MRRPDGRVLLDGAKRFVGLVAGAGVVACLLGFLLGALLHEGIRRGLAIGFYFTGAGLAGLGFVFGSRPPVRSRSDGGLASILPFSFFGGSGASGGVRWASADEHKQAMNLPAVLVAVGVVLVLIGIAVDTGHVRH